ncbi:MAG: nicotinate (nicotinamide) nucleotide adenylyltransferase [Candidatus Cloacimonetes bacterium]|nr:nicotinate (nicotinamide) nucleotide adenylyltransferase [Candidatus Cloacimonadota bacterium]
MGGTFDPFHAGHLKVAETAIEKLPIDFVWFVPAAKPPHKKKCMFSFEERINLIKEAIKDNSSFSIWEKDIRENDKSFTYYLIKELKDLYPNYQFFFIIGADNVLKLKTWYRFEDLLEMIDFIVIDRKTQNKKEWKHLDYFHKLIFLDMPLINISSTKIRKDLIKNFNKA